MTFGMKIIYHNRNPLAEYQAARAKYVHFDELIAEADVISLNLPLNESTKHTLSTREFEKMKNGVVIVNTGRGGLIDEAALVAALESGKVYAAGLDVFEEEPKIHPGLVGNDKVFLTPHLGARTFEAQVCSPRSQ
jgi:glyoxylate reductase